MAARDPPLVYDELTGLPGRGILDDRLRVALARAARDGRRVAVILADVDAMKDINDSFGHAVGDDVLRGLARAMSRGLRTGDTVARFGGDEFVMLVDGLDESDTAWQFAERLQDAVSRTPVETAAGALVVTASFGLAVGTPLTRRLSCCSGPTPRCIGPRRWARQDGRVRRRRRGEHHTRSPTSSQSRSAMV